ncbi:MAG TPA: membrane protein insertion efficiency factor YidD [Terriglobales bacterium]|nr:membrane protein insertion efficiency factor YidD [Terriglobales bacterium]
MIRAYLLLMLRGYKAFLSPMLPNACRFVPTCSEYAMEAISHYGAFRGGYMALWRLLRCHPFSPGGYDPVILSEKPAGTPEVAEECLCSADHPVRAEAVPQPEFTSPTLRPNVWRC